MRENNDYYNEMLLPQSSPFISSTQVTSYLANSCESVLQVVDVGALMRFVDSWNNYCQQWEQCINYQSAMELGVVPLLAQTTVSFRVFNRQDAASIRALGVDSGQIFVANPCKTKSHINSIGDNELVCVDSEKEVHKLKSASNSSTFHIMVMIRSVGSVELGAYDDEWSDIVYAMKRLDLTMAGVCFECLDMLDIQERLETARRVFDCARSIGLDPHILDVGSVSYSVDTVMDHMNDVVSDAVDLAFYGVQSPSKLLCDPGNICVQVASTLATKVLRVSAVNDDILQYEFATKISQGSSLVAALSDDCSSKPIKSVALSADWVVNLPQVNTGDWLLWSSNGSSTIIDVQSRVYTVSEASPTVRSHRRAPRTSSRHRSCSSECAADEELERLTSSTYFHDYVVQS